MTTDTKVSKPRRQTADTDSALTEEVDQARDQSDDAQNETLEALTQSIAELREIVQRKSERAGKRSIQFIGENPFVAVAIAAGAGVLVGLLITRKRTAPTLTDSLQRYVPSSRSVSAYIPNDLSTGRSISGRVENLIDSISQIDAKSVGGPAMEMFRDLYSNFRSMMKSVSN